MSLNVLLVHEAKKGFEYRIVVDMCFCTATYKKRHSIMDALMETFKFFTQLIISGFNTITATNVK